MLRKLDVIELTWSGPHTPESVIKDCVNAHDYGIYQLYGTHPISGPNTLLYIGKARDSSFSARIAGHKNRYFEYETKPIEVYLGRLGSIEPMSRERWPQWDREIDIAERLLISQCVPPYNSEFINNPGPFEIDTLLINHLRRNRLPESVCSLARNSAARSNDWFIYGRESAVGK